MIIAIIFVLIAFIVCYFGINRKHKFRQDALDKYYKDFVKEKDGNFISFKSSLKETELPIVKMTINGNRYGFLLDTGANWNFIDSALVEELSKDMNLQIIGGGEFTSGTSTNNKSNKVEIPFSYNNVKFEEMFSVADLRKQFDEVTKNTNVKLYGILGNAFMQKNRWKLNFEKMIVMFP